MLTWSTPTSEAALATYEWGGTTLASNLALLRVIETATRPLTTFVWRLSAAPQLPPVRHRWTVRFPDRSTTEVHVGGDAERLRYGMEELGAFILLPLEGAIDFFPRPEADPMRVEHVLVNTILPLFMGLRGTLCLHAAAVAGGDAAIVLVGPSGVGKSTAAWGLVRDDGLRFLADDAAVVRQVDGEWLVHPTARTLRRICDDSDPGSWNNRGKREFLMPATTEAVRVREIRVLVRASRQAVPEGALPFVVALTTLASLQAGWRWMGPRLRTEIQSQIAALVLAVPPVVFAVPH